MRKNDKELVVQVATTSSRRRRWITRLFYGLAGVFAALTAALYTPGHALTSSGVTTFLSNSAMILFAVVFGCGAMRGWCGVVPRPAHGSTRVDGHAGSAGGCVLHAVDMGRGDYHSCIS